VDGRDKPGHDDERDLRGHYVDILMPQLGETVAEGKITKWFKSAGDAVKPGDNLFEIETDKVSMEVPATAAGTLAEIRVAAGEVAPVGAVVAVLGDKVGAALAPQVAKTGAPPKTPLTPAQAPRPAAAQHPVIARTAPLDPFNEVRTATGNYGPARLASGIVTTPLARRLAAEKGIDLSKVNGSGPHGRIIARDVESGHVGAKASPEPSGFSGAQVLALYADRPYEEIPLDGMRRTIAARLVQSKQTIPHFYLSMDVDLGALLTAREEINASMPKNNPFKISVNDFIIKALAAALQRVPAANAVWAEDRVLRFQHSDIGVAVAIDGGLLTPVIRDAEMKSLTAISAEMKDLAGRARERKLRPQEYQGGSTAISNLGMYGIREFSAIINPPQASILAVGAVQRRAVEDENGAVVFRSQMTVTLSSDHRVIDGALGAQLLDAFKSLIERPLTMLV
jgi:pyruvate dehydrogenase E2 component (dihydrolipoamide acetyltransferase)